MGTKAAVAVGLAGAAAGAIVGSLLIPGEVPAETRAEAATLRERVVELEAAAAAPAAKGAFEEARIAEKERRIAELEAALAEARRASPVPAAPPPATGARAVESLPAGEDRRRAVIAELERVKKALEDEKAAFDGPTKEEARRVFLDPSLSEEERATALSRLRTLKGIDRELAMAVATMFRSSRKAGIREWLLRDVHGTKDPELKRLFLDALRDPEPKERERPGRAIDDYLDDPSVVAALEGLRDGDPVEEVRRRAIRTLAKKDPDGDD